MSARPGPHDGTTGRGPDGTAGVATNPREVDGATPPTGPGETPAALTYAGAGVDVEAGDRAVDLMRRAVAATHGPQVLGGVGGFAGLYDASALLTMRRPLLASATDGVGTKVAIAQAMDVHDTVGIDLVGMVVDDIVCCGARPLAMTDYLATGRVDPERVAAVVRGVATGCRATGTALVGGETAEHPGLMEPGAYDLAGAAVGVVEAADLLGPERVEAGDVLVALASSGPHANGYSLIRAIVAREGLAWDRHVPEFGRSLGEELLEPTRLYTAVCLALAADDAAHLHALAHVTGGGLAANLARVVPAGLTAVVDRGTWQVPVVFEVLRAWGRVPTADAERTWNLGVGMVAVVGAPGVDAALTRLAAAGVPAWVAGRLASDDALEVGPEAVGSMVHGAKGVSAGRVLLTGEYRASRPREER